MKTVPTICPFCSCGCGLYLQSVNGSLAGSAPSERHPVAKGTLCARGWAAHEAPVWGSRVVHPLVRRAGELQPTTWEDAVARAAAALLATVGAGRSVGVLGSAKATNEENFLAAKLARAALQTPHIDTSIGWTFKGALAGFTSASGLPAPSTEFNDIATADLILLIDCDIASTHPKLASTILHAVSAGATLVALAHRATQMTRLAKLFILLKPGLEMLTLKQLAAAVRSARDPAKGNASSGTTTLADAARLLVGAQRPLAVVAPATPMIEHEGPVALLTATLGSHESSEAHGPRILIVPHRANLRGAVEMGATPAHLPGLAPIDDHAARQRLSSLWQRPICADAGEEAAAMLGGVSALVVVADDPAANLLLPQRAAAALHRLDCLVVLDAYMTPTASLAEVVLPIPAPGEVDGTMTNLEGRVQTVAAAAPPPSGARAAWQALSDLMTAVGLPAHYTSPVEIRREIASAIPSHARIDPGGFPQRHANRPSPRAVAASPDHLHGEPYDEESSSLLLTLDGSFDWSADPLVVHSPSLSRQYASRNRLFPQGFAEMARSDAATLGIRSGWSVKLAANGAEIVLPVVLRDDLPSGTLLTPFAFRGIVTPLLGDRSAVAVNVQRA